MQPWLDLRPTFTAGIKGLHCHIQSVHFSSFWKHVFDPCSLPITKWKQFVGKTASSLTKCSLAVMIHFHRIYFFGLFSGWWVNACLGKLSSDIQPWGSDLVVHVTHLGWGTCLPSPIKPVGHFNWYRSSPLWEGTIPRQVGLWLYVIKRSQ